MINSLKKSPMISKVLSLFTGKKNFDGSENYWIRRYQKGGNSGDGSYNELAEFKARIINDFAEKNNVQSSIEFGCGDGNQLKYLKLKKYTGFDVSPDAIAWCKKTFKDDSTKSFKLIGEFASDTAELSMSLDVIYHLIEDEVYEQYMQNLFNAASKFVIVYASNTAQNPATLAPHVKNRKFTDWIEKNRKDFKQIAFIKNEYPITPDGKRGSIADFYIFAKN
jgi:SAM-dependent methyltransferase